MKCLIFFVFFPVLSAFASPWDTQGAALSFQQARQKRSEIEQTAQPTLLQYLECARTYRNVYLKDPHYGRAGDAVYEEGVVYQEAADRFEKPEYYRTAVNRFRFLVGDYGANQNCPDALIRSATIYWNKLDEETAAREALERLRKSYRYSKSAVERIQAGLAPRMTPEALDRPEQPQRAPKAVTPQDSAPPGVASTVRNIRFWTTAEYTRVTIDMEADARYQKARLSHPDRVYFDIEGRLSTDLHTRPIVVDDGVLKQVRAAQKSPGTVRVVLDIADMTEHQVSVLHDPFRIIIDLRKKSESAAVSSPQARQSSPAASTGTGAKSSPAEPASHEQSVLPKRAGDSPLTVQAKTEGAASGPKAKQPPAVPETMAAVTGTAEAKTGVPDIKAPAIPAEAPPIPRQASPTSSGDRTLTRMLGLKVGRIVIDPGHGGHDTGTKGPGGLLEKDLVFSLAHDLKRMIEEKLGAEVFLTRDEDVFVSLEERTAIANAHRADLFISIHANSSRIRSISGVETYYLDFARTDTEREIAARENATSAKSVSDLEDLIKKIAQADKSTESRELASIVQKKLHSGARQVFPSTRNRGVRSAPFIVLIGANMPSVLAEVAFISNPRDERLLKKASNRQRLVNALFTGLEGYMKTLGGTVVQNQISSQGQ